MTKRAPPWWIEFSLKYWQPLLALGAGVMGLLVFLWTLNPRLAAQEKKVSELEKATIALTAIESQNSQLLTQMVQQQVANQATPAPWTFIKEDGDWQVFRNPDKELFCCNGTVCVPKPLKGKCPS